MGKISYGTYLWHFPLFALLDSARMHLYGYPLLVVRIGVTLLVATASFYLVEEPIRRGRMRSLTEWKAWLADQRGPCLRRGLVTVAATLPSPAEAAGVPCAWRVRSTAGPPVKVAHLRRLGGLAAGFAIASQPQNDYDVNIDQRCHHRLRGAPELRVPAHGVSRPDDLVNATRPAQVAPVAGPVAAAT